MGCLRPDGAGVADAMQQAPHLLAAALHDLPDLTGPVLQAAAAVLLLAGIVLAAVWAATLQRNRVTRQIIFTTRAAKPPPAYSQAVKAAGLVFVSGTSPADAVTGTIQGTTIQTQTRQCLANIQAILEEAGSSLDKVVSVTVVLADEDDFAGMNEEWLRWFPANPPARQGAKLPARIPGLKVSIAAIALA
jgi:2-iminobutanoate/2-iminopropanoate deaminase